ncbi:hypothetical protein [Campylobacter suis]|uniref:Uncharacterized protein n=1 Tax=Campylobacter suis TaxID=2790657 RepID=A0ABM8Q8E8_9BACT|nr:hypothetical protein [Campylobacter suis]CAD7289109.1 hypothetical protein LMG8286_01652 [Campylobacter suis]
MKKIALLLSCMTLLFGQKAPDFSIYENLLKTLKPAEIAQFIAVLAVQYLPAKINENITLNTISAKNSELNGTFIIEKDKSNLKSDLVLGAKRDLCENELFVKVLHHDLTLNGVFLKDGKEKFRISVDRQFCER